MANDNETADENASDSPFTDRTKLDEIDIVDRPYNIYRCQECKNTVLSLHDCGTGMTCHGETMEPVRDVTMNVNPPSLRDVLLNVFGIPKVGLDICLCVIDEGPLSPDEVADKMGYDGSTIRRYLNQLTEVGVLRKMQLNREDGGFVNVYRSIDIDEMQRESLAGFYMWAGEAATLIEEANLTKEDYLDSSSEENMNEVFWESFQRKTGRSETE